MVWQTCRSLRVFDLVLVTKDEPVLVWTQTGHCSLPTRADYSSACEQPMNLEDPDPDDCAANHHCDVQTEFRDVSLPLRSKEWFAHTPETN